MSRKLYQYGQWVVVKGGLFGTSKKYQVECDYEDWIYLIGVKEPVRFEQVKLA